MFYKPNYCCNCAEKIERVEWFPWTSRRFCETCETRFKIHDRIPVFFVAFGILLSIFGMGAYLKSGNGELPVAVKQKSLDIAKSSQNSANLKTASPNVNVQTLLQQPEPSVADNQTKTAQPPPKVKPVQTKSEPPEAVYFCGAQTKKGTPCSRRVKGGGRCWQHREQPAMLPPEKLIASQ